MKLTILLLPLAVSLAVATAPAFADSIPTPPVTTINFYAATVNGAYTSAASYFFASTNDWQDACSSAGVGSGSGGDCLMMEVEHGTTNGYARTNFADLWGSAGGDAGLGGFLGKVTFNPSTDVLSGVFWGKEDVYATGTDYPPAWYQVQGMFVEDVQSGNGQVTLTSEKYIGLRPVPEPGTVGMMAVGMMTLFSLRLKGVL